MLAFCPRGQARFSFRAVFHRDDYCNLSFYDADRSRILYHLSLRAAQGLAAVNRRGKGATDWGRERKIAMPLPVSGVEVSIHFEGGKVRVEIDGQEVATLGSGLIRRFPDLSQIAFVDFQGGLLGPTLDMDVQIDDPLGRNREMRLNQRLELRGRLNSTEPLHLELPPMKLPPRLITVPDGESQELRAIIPGRVWQSVSQEDPLDLSVRLPDGALIAKMSISRGALATRITMLLEQSPNLYGDLLAATQIVEHVRFGELAPRLSASALAQLALLARAHGFESFLGPLPRPSRTEKVVLPADPGADHRRAVDACMARYAVRMRDDPAVGPADALLADPPEASILRDVCLNLTESACRHDNPGAFTALFAAARKLGLGRMPQMDNPWSQSAVLPWRVLEGDVAALPKPIQTLAWNRFDWLLTAPLSWTVRHILDHPPNDRKALAWTVEAFVSFIGENAKTYWDRATCIELCHASARLFSARDRFEDPLASLIESEILNIYALTPAFWTALDPGEDPRGLRHAWETLQGQVLQGDASDDVTQRALGQFERTGCLDLPRFRRDLFGTAQIPERTTDAEEAALRHLAHPLTSESACEDTKLAALARAAMPRLYKETALGTHGAAQAHASQLAARILDAPHGDAGLDPDMLGDFAEAAETLPVQEGLGVGLALSVLAGLLSNGQEAEAAQWMTAIRPLLITPLPDKPPLHRAHAQLARLGTHPLAQEALAALPAANLSGRIPPEDLGKRRSPLHDTLITIFSCRPHLETRIPQMRAGWLSDLDRLGVPYVVIIGGGDNPDGVLDGDVLTLAAADDYEGLPQKTLAAVRWVHDHTDFAHLLKVDDDCFLNAEAFFHAQSHAKFDYYGRPLIRIVGQMDRSWHVAKSTTARGRLELDKSPEPSLYADGGSGYALSRRAMAAALDALGTPQGQALVQTSFMEDKLLGDLLALQGIFVSGEDYHITVRRREAPGGRAIPRWVNGFDASQTMPVKLVHLDDPAAQGAAQARLQTPAVRPAKIWPSFQDAALGPHSNALEMISDAARLDAARAAPVSVVACMRNEMFMLPHFLRHYRNLGVESFLVADNCSDDGTLEFLAEEPDVAVFTVDTEYNRSHYGVAWQQALLSAFRVDKWSLVADADELLIWQDPQTQNLPDLLLDDAFADADAVRVFMLDMYPEGPLAAADFTSGDLFAEAGMVERVPFLETSLGRGPFSDNPTWTSALRHRLIPGSRPDLFVAQKMALLRYRPWMRASAGFHYVSGCRVAEPELFFAHFKYNADFRRKVQAEVARGQHFNNAEEYRKYLAVVSEGRDVIYDAAHSVPWSACDFVTARLRPQVR